MDQMKHEGLPQFSADTKCLVGGAPQAAIYANRSKHPTEIMQKNAFVDGERKKLQEMSVMYGSAFAQSHVIEANIMASVQRPSGYKSSMFGLRHHLGHYNTIENFDILNDPNENPCIDAEGMRSRVEATFW